MRSHITPILIAMLLFFCSTAAVCSAGDIPETPVQDMVFVPVNADPVALPVPTPAFGSASVATAIAYSGSEFSKLEITPSYVHFMLKPGGSGENTVTIRNRDTKTVSIRPVLQQYPYGGPYEIDSPWVTVSPQQADIPAGESVKITIRVAAPADAERGSYSSMMAITDEKYPTEYAPAYPSYIHTISLSLDVTGKPIVRTDPAFISDQLESGRDYHYSVNITSNGQEPLTLAPKIGSDSYPVYTISGMQEPPLSADSFTITAPQAVPPGGNATLMLSVKAPEGTSGSYNGYLDLGIDSPDLREGEGRIPLNFIVWQQPAESYTRQFVLPSSGQVTVTLTTTGQTFVMPLSARSSPASEPEFSVSFTGPDGSTVPARLAGKEIKGSVSMGGDSFLYGTAARPGDYQDMSSQYVSTYTAQLKAGTWTLSVMPKNTQMFDYSIAFGRPAGSVASFFSSLGMG